MADLEDPIYRKVFLLKMLKREKGESMEDIKASLADTGMFTLEEADRLLEKLTEEGYVLGGEQLSMLGVAEAKKAEEEFTL